MLCGAQFVVGTGGSPVQSSEADGLQSTGGGRNWAASRFVVAPAASQPHLQLKTEN